jgi:hypothetical protein
LEGEEKMDSIRKKAAAFWAGGCSEACRVFPEGPYLKGYNAGFSDGLRSHVKDVKPGILTGTAGVIIDAFLEAEYQEDLESRVPSSKLYPDFLKWHARHDGVGTVTHTWFGKQLAQRFRKVKLNGRIFYLGLAPRTKTQPTADAGAGIGDQG